MPRIDRITRIRIEILWRTLNYMIRGEKPYCLLVEGLVNASKFG